VATHSLLPDKKTAGVDGVKALTPKQRINLVGKLRLTGKAKPTLRVNIPKLLRSLILEYNAKY